MRKQSLEIEVQSNCDLTQLNSSRITVQKTEKGYLFTSPLKFYSCERHGFLKRLICRNFKITVIRGNCSRPSGYFTC
jgi:hypothetical protein